MQFLVNIWNAQRNAAGIEHEKATTREWYKRVCNKGEEIMKLRAENAALRSQINQRGAGRKFTKKSPTE